MGKKRHKDGKEVNLSHASHLSVQGSYLSNTNISNLPIVSIDPLYHAVLRAEEGVGQKEDREK